MLKKGSVATIKILLKLYLRKKDQLSSNEVFWLSKNETDNFLVVAESLLV